MISHYRLCGHSTATMPHYHLTEHHSACKQSGIIADLYIYYSTKPKLKPKINSRRASLVEYPKGFRVAVNIWGGITKTYLYCAK